MPTYRKKMSIRRKKPTSKSGVVSDSVKKYVKSVTKKALPEMKYVASTVTPTEFDMLLDNVSFPGWLWTEFLGISQGTGVNQRVGNKIKLQGYHSKISYFNNSTVPVYVRRLVVSYATNDAIATSGNAELFNNTGDGQSIFDLGNSMNIIQLPINPVQYKVYFDKTFRLGPSTSTDGTNTRIVNYFEKFGGKIITYENNATGLEGQSVRFAEIIFCVTANNDVTTGAKIEFTRNTKTYFTDP